MSADLMAVWWYIGAIGVLALVAGVLSVALWYRRFRGFFERRAASRARRQTLEAYARGLRSQR